MAFIVTGIAIGGMALSAYGAYKSNQAGKAQAAEAARQGFYSMSEAIRQEELQKLEADRIQEQAVTQAAAVRRQAMGMRGALAAAQASSGVVIGEGSAQAAMDMIDTLSAADTLAALYAGADKAVATRQNAEMVGEAGHNSFLSGLETANTIRDAANAQLIGSLGQIAVNFGARMYSPSSAPSNAPTGGSGLTTGSTYGTLTPGSGGFGLKIKG